MGLDVIVNLGLAPLIRALVNYIKPTWSKVDENLTPVINVIVASLLGIGLSFAWQAYEPTGDSISRTVALGVLSGVAAILYNDVRARLVESKGSGLAVVGEVTKSSVPKSGRKKVTSKEKVDLKVGSVTPQQ